MSQNKHYYVKDTKIKKPCISLYYVKFSTFIRKLSVAYFYMKYLNRVKM